MDLLDIVIVNHKSTEFLMHCLHSVFTSKNGVPIQVFLEDNNSQDGVEHVKETFPHVDLTMNDCNMGFARAVNQAIRKGCAPYVMLLNPDTVLSKELISSTLDYIESNPKVGIVGPRILDRDGSIQGSARRFPTVLTGFFGRTTLLSRLFPRNRFTCANILTIECDGKTPLEVDWVSGACMLIRRKALADVGHFDERFFLYWEDADLCRRVREYGWKVMYYPATSIMHHVGGSSDKNPFRSVFEFHKSSYFLFTKYAKGKIRLMKPLAIVGLSLHLTIVLARHSLRLLSS